jgi:hypothetical protein
MSTALKNIFPDIDLDSADLTETLRKHICEIRRIRSPHQLSTETQNISKRIGPAQNVVKPEISFTSPPGFTTGAYFPPQPIRQRILSADSAIDVVSQSKSTITAPQADHDSQFLASERPSMQQANLLAMMYPSIDAINVQGAPSFSSQMYSRFAVPTENGYFPYVNAGWENVQSMDQDMGDP